MDPFIIKAHWDPEATVWWAESDDVPGLVAESETHEGLMVELRQLVPELLAMNLPDRDVSHASMQVISDQVEEVRAA